MNADPTAAPVPDRPRGWGQSALGAFFVLALGVVLGLTLLPGSGHDTGRFQLCLLCGDLGLSDFLANILLFLPLGLALCGITRRPALTVGALLLLSVAIEVAQLWIPGRESTLGDIAANTLGGALGAGVASWWPRRRRSPRGAAVAVAAALLAIAAGGVALHPYFPPTRYFGQWTPELGQFGVYRGRVLSAEIGTLALPSWELPDSRAARARLRAGDRVLVRAVAGPPTERLAPLFAIADDRAREILLLGVDGDDLVFEVSTSAPDLRLDQPRVAWSHALSGIAAGDSLVVRAWRQGAGVCLQVNDRARCGVPFATDELWRLLGSPPRRLAWAAPAAGWAIVALLGFAVGLLAPRRASGWLIVAALLCGVALVPISVGLAPLSALDAVVLLAGIVAGLALPAGRSVTARAAAGTLPV